MKVLSVTLVLVALYLALTQRARASPVSAGTSVRQVICGVFGPYCDQALRVAWCESRFSTSASNGQYLGLFQMGDYARSKYGHGPDPWTQAQAAFRYFADCHYRWTPWSCKP